LAAPSVFLPDFYVLPKRLATGIELDLSIKNAGEGFTFAVEIYNVLSHTVFTALIH